MVQTKQSSQQQKQNSTTGKFVVLSYSDVDKAIVTHKALGIYNNEEAAYAAAIVFRMQSIESAVSARKRLLKAHLSAKQTLIHKLCKSIKEDFTTYKDRFKYLTEQCQLLFDQKDIQQNASSLCREHYVVLPILNDTNTLSDSMNTSVFKIKVRNFHDVLRVEDDIEEDLENSDGEDDDDDEEEEEEEEEEEDGDEDDDDVEQESDDDDEDENLTAEENPDAAEIDENNNIEEEENEEEAIDENDENEDVPEEDEDDEVQQQNDDDASDGETDEVTENDLEDGESEDDADEELLDTEDTIVSNTAIVTTTSEQEQRRSLKRKSRAEEEDEEDEEVDEIDEDNEEDEFELLEEEDEVQQPFKKHRITTVL